MPDIDRGTKKVDIQQQQNPYQCSGTLQNVDRLIQIRQNWFKKKLS